MLKKIPIADASAAQLREYCATVLGLEVSPSSNKARLQAQIEEVQPGTETVLVADVPVAAAVPTPATPLAKPIVDEAAALAAIPATAHQHDPKVRISIPSVEKPGGDQDVQVSVNGVVFIIKRNVETQVPYRVYEALAQAYETIYEQRRPAPNLPAEMTSRNVLSYAFNILSMPSPDEIETWRERTKDALVG